MPINYHKSASILIKQVENYINKAKRLEIAKKIIDSGTTTLSQTSNTIISIMMIFS